MFTVRILIMHYCVFSTLLPPIVQWSDVKPLVGLCFHPMCAMCAHDNNQNMKSLQHCSLALVVTKHKVPLPHKMVLFFYEYEETEESFSKMNLKQHKLLF